MSNESLLRIPLYVQVREKLREDLASAVAGTMIPPEAMLEERFSVSRVTIRKAIDDLVSDGLLVRKQGRGTFRQIPVKTQERSAITSWTTEMKALGYLPQTASREIAEINPPRKIAHLLNLAAGEKVIQIRRTRLANDEPITLMVNYIPSLLVPGFQEADMQCESLYDFLKTRFGLSAAEAYDTVETRPASEAESERLRIEVWEPVLVVTRRTWLADRRPLEVGISVSCGRRYEYRACLRSRLLTWDDLLKPHY